MRIHVLLGYGMYFVLGSMMILVKNGPSESPEKSDIIAETTVYMATKPQRFHVLRTTDIKTVWSDGPMVV